MAKTVQYWGTTNYMEQPLTGRLVLWSPKQKSDVPDDIATKLIAANVGFMLDQDSVGEMAVWSDTTYTALATPSGSVSLGGGGSAELIGRGSVAYKLANTYLEGASTYKTIQTSIASVTKFYAVRLCVANYSTAAASTVTNVKVASAPTLTDNGSALTWSQVTWNGGSTSATIPIATGTTFNIVPGVLYSDVCYITAVPRTDVPADPHLLYIRTYDAALRYGSFLCPKEGQDPDAWLLANGFTFRYGGSATDQVTLTTTGITMSNSFPQCPISAVEFYSAGPVFSLHCFGDSLLAGYSGNASGYVSGWCNRLLAGMRSTGKVGGIANWGIGGSGHDTYIQRMKDVVTQVKPDAVYFSSYSPNSGFLTQAGLDAQFGQTLAALHWLKDAGVSRIYISTAMPVYGTLNAPQKALFDAYNINVRALSSMATILDFALAIDPTNAGIIPASYIYLTGPHINYAGDQVLADYVAGVLGLV